MNKSNHSLDPKETRGWEIVKQLNEGLKSGAQGKGAKNEMALTALDARRLLAEYIKLDCRKPSRLHSAILSCAVKMAVVFSDFHFVPFLNIWGLQHLRKEDAEARTDESGKRFSSLTERLAKAYAYSLLFHRDERLASEQEQLLLPLLKEKGYVMIEGEGRLCPVTTALALRTFQSDVRGRKMTFVSFLTPEGDELTTEVHTITAHCRMRYDDIPNRLFDLLLRKSESGNIRVEAAVLSSATIGQVFETSIGYVDHIDLGHRHIHVYDKESRHLVQKFDPTTTLQEGQYVEFVPLIPKEGNFKEAFILQVLLAEEGPTAFGYRDAVVTYVDSEKGYCAWELLPDADGTIRGIVEKDAKEPQEPATKGYLNKELADRRGVPLPEKGTKIRIITFLKRGKDGKKRPVVVDFKVLDC